MAEGEPAEIRFAPPPRPVVRALNVGFRQILRTPLGRVLPLALLEFRGRTSGRLYRVPVGWHPVGAEHVVVSQGTWPKNFVGGHPATVHHRGRARSGFGTYVDDPHEVAAAFRAIVAAGISPRTLALQVPAGRLIEPADMARLGRAIIRFTT